MLAAGIATLGGALSDYRNFERWYRQADASQRAPNLAELGNGVPSGTEVPIAMLMDLTLPLSIELGRTRMTVQGRPTSGLWLITEGEALVSANARPLRVLGYGDAVGISDAKDWR